MPEKSQPDFEKTLALGWTSSVPRVSGQSEGDRGSLWNRELFLIEAHVMGQFQSKGALRPREDRHTQCSGKRGRARTFSRAGGGVVFGQHRSGEKPGLRGASSPVSSLLKVTSLPRRGLNLLPHVNYKKHLALSHCS